MIINLLSDLGFILFILTKGFSIADADGTVFSNRIFEVEYPDMWVVQRKTTIS